MGKLLGSGSLTGQGDFPLHRPGSPLPHPSSKESGGHTWTRRWSQRRGPVPSPSEPALDPNPESGDDLGCPPAPGWTRPLLPCGGRGRAQLPHFGELSSLPAESPGWVGQCPRVLVPSRAGGLLPLHPGRPRGWGSPRPPRARRRDHQHERRQGRAATPRSGHCPRPGPGPLSAPPSPRPLLPLRSKRGRGTGVRELGSQGQDRPEAPRCQDAQHRCPAPGYRVPPEPPPTPEVGTPPPRLTDAAREAQRGGTMARGHSESEWSRSV